MPPTPPKDTLVARVLALFFIVFAVLALVAGYAVWTINRSVESSDWVNQTYATIYELENIGSSLRLGEGYARTYAQTGNARDLAASRNAFGQLGEHLDTAKALLRRDAKSRDRLLAIETLTQEREKFARAIFAARGGKQLDKVQALLDGDAGPEAVSAIQDELNKLRDEQFELLNARDQILYGRAQNTRWVVGVGIGLNFALLAAIGWLLRDDIAARRRAATIMAEANAQLETKVRERTAELVETNTKLETENLERTWTITSQEHQIRYNQRIIESLGELVFVITKAINITRINPAVVHHTGREELDVLMKPLHTVIECAPDPGTGLDPIARALQEGRDLRDHPVHVLGRGGRRLPARLVLSPIYDENRVVGAVIIVQVAFSASNLPSNPPSV